VTNAAFAPQQPEREDEKEATGDGVGQRNRKTGTSTGNLPTLTPAIVMELGGSGGDRGGHKYTNMNGSKTRGHYASETWGNGPGRQEGGGDS